MTNRNWIYEVGKMPPKMRPWIGTLFPTLNLDTVKIEFGFPRAYGRQWKALADCRGVEINFNDWFEPMTTNTFFQLMAHELVHVESCRNTGWVRWFVGMAKTMLRSIPKGSIYLHSESDEERQAAAMQQKWFESCWPVQRIGKTYWTRACKHD